MCPFCMKYWFNASRYLYLLRRKQGAPVFILSLSLCQDVLDGLILGVNLCAERVDWTEVKPRNCGTSHRQQGRLPVQLCTAGAIACWEKYSISAANTIQDYSEFDLRTSHIMYPSQIKDVTVSAVASSYTDAVGEGLSPARRRTWTRQYTPTFPFRPASDWVLGYWPIPGSTAPDLAVGRVSTVVFDCLYILSLVCMCHSGWVNAMTSCLVVWFC